MYVEEQSHGKEFRIHVWLAHFSVFSPICLKGGGRLIWVLYIIVFIMTLKGNYLYNQQSVHLLWLCGKLVSYTWYRWNQSPDEGGGDKFVNKFTWQYEYLLHYFLLVLPSGFCSVDFFQGQQYTKSFLLTFCVQAKIHFFSVSDKPSHM